VKGDTRAVVNQSRCCKC